jgi:hypothetical protein
MSAACVSAALGTNGDAARGTRRSVAKLRPRARFGRGIEEANPTGTAIRVRWRFSEIRVVPRPVSVKASARRRVPLGQPDFEASRGCRLVPANSRFRERGRERAGRAVSTPFGMVSKRKSICPNGTCWSPMAGVFRQLFVALPPGGRRHECTNDSLADRLHEFIESDSLDSCGIGQHSDAIT